MSAKIAYVKLKGGRVSGPGGGWLELAELREMMMTLVPAAGGAEVRHLLAGLRHVAGGVFTTRSPPTLNLLPLLRASI